jgi:hypothetical protein
MQRTAHLTSPPMRGLDIQHLQQAINARLKSRGGQHIPETGIWTTVDEHALRTAAFDLGLDAFDGSPAVTHVVENPGLRLPGQLARAHSRAKARAQHAQGLAQIPVIAAKFIGVHEVPAGSNKGHPQPSGWEDEIIGSDGSPWCGCFSGGVIILAGGHVTSRIAYCPFVEADARTGTGGFDAWTTDHNQAGPGWVVVYQFPGNSVPDHQGIVESLHPDHLVAIEGNTSGDNPVDGGMVARTQRTYSSVVGFARPRMA